MSISARRRPCAPCFRAVSHLFLTKPYVADRIGICIFQIRKNEVYKIEHIAQGHTSSRSGGLVLEVVLAVFGSL